MHATALKYVHVEDALNYKQELRAVVCGHPQEPERVFDVAFRVVFLLIRRSAEMRWLVVQREMMGTSGSYYSLQNFGRDLASVISKINQ